MSNQNSKQEQNCQAILTPDTNIFNESLILAQDERWRRA